MLLQRVKATRMIVIEQGGEGQQNWIQILVLSKILFIYCILSLIPVGESIVDVILYILTANNKSNKGPILFV